MATTQWLGYSNSRHDDPYSRRLSAGEIGVAVVDCGAARTSIGGFRDDAQRTLLTTLLAHRQPAEVTPRLTVKAFSEKPIGCIWMSTDASGLWRSRDAFFGSGCRVALDPVSAASNLLGDRGLTTMSALQVVTQKGVQAATLAAIKRHQSAAR